MHNNQKPLESTSQDANNISGTPEEEVFFASQDYSGNLDEKGADENTVRIPNVNLLGELDDTTQKRMSIDERILVEVPSLEKNPAPGQKFSNHVFTPTERRAAPLETQASENMPTEYNIMTTEKTERSFVDDAMMPPTLKSIVLDKTSDSTASNGLKRKTRVMRSISNIRFRSLFSRSYDLNLLTEVEYQILNDKTCQINSLPEFSKIRKQRLNAQLHILKMREALLKHGIIKKKNHHQEFVRKILSHVKSNRKPVLHNIKKSVLKIVEYLKYLSHSKKHFQKIFSNVINPIGLFRMTWDLVCFFFIIFDLFFMPFDAGFEINRGSFLKNVLFIETLYFMIDIMLNFYTGYFKDGVMIKQKGLIAKKYLSGWFWVDALATFPFDWFFHDSIFYDHPDEEEQNVGRYLRLIKIIRIFRFKAILGRLEDKFQFDNYITGIITLLKLVFMIIVCCHWAACFWYLVGIYNQKELGVSWLQELSALYIPTHQKYVLSLYWAVATMLTVGYGDVAPKTNTERFYVVIVMLCGCGVFGFTMNSIGLLLQSIQAHASKTRQKIWAIKKFMHAHELSKATQNQVENYLEYMMEVERQQKLVDQSVLASLSDTLKGQVLREINGKVLSSNQLFLRNFGTKFLFELYNQLEQNIFSPGDVIFRQSDPDITMYFIKTGRVEIYLENNNQILKTLCVKMPKDEFFGEYSFFTNRSRLASARSENFSFLLFMRQKKFLDLLEKFPYEKEIYHSIKDGVNLYSNYKALHIVCYACEQPDHYAAQCPNIHYVRDRYDAITYYLQKTKEFRESFRRRMPKKRWHALSPDILNNVSERILNHFSENYFITLFDSSHDANNNSLEEKMPSTLLDLNKEKHHAIATYVTLTKLDPPQSELLDTGTKEKSYERGFVSRKNLRKKAKIIKDIPLDKVKNFIGYFAHNNISFQVEKLNRNQRALEKKIELQREIQQIARRINYCSSKYPRLKTISPFLHGMATEALEKNSERERMFSEEDEILNSKFSREYD